MHSRLPYRRLTRSLTSTVAVALVAGALTAAPGAGADQRAVPKVRSKVALGSVALAPSRDALTVRGKVTSPKKKCRKGRTVVVRVPGSKLGSAKTKAGGKFQLRVGFDPAFGSGSPYPFRPVDHEVRVNQKKVKIKKRRTTCRSARAVIEVAGAPGSTAVTATATTLSGKVTASDQRCVAEREYLLASVVDGEIVDVYPSVDYFTTSENGDWSYAPPFGTEPEETWVFFAPARLLTTSVKGNRGTVEQCGIIEAASGTSSPARTTENRRLPR